MLSENELKKELKSIAKSKFQPPDETTIPRLIPAMLTYIGSTDPELRDDLIYVAFVRWSMTYNLLSNETLREIFTTLLDDEHLLFRFGEKNTEASSGVPSLLYGCPPFSSSIAKKPS